MRRRVRLATTAGVTVLSFTAMSGMAEADTGGGLGLPDLTSPLAATTGTVGKTVDGVVKQTTGSSGGSGLRLSLPAGVSLGAPRSSAAGNTAPAVKAHVKAGLKASVAPVGVRARVNLRLCAGSATRCGERVPSPPIPIPPAPPTPPPPTPIGSQPPSAPPGTGSGTSAQSAGSLTISGDSLPFTGGPVGTLALLGVAAVVTGAAGVAASRLRTNRG
jgi:hypothetical protein